MRVLCNFTGAGPSFVRTGWAKVFAALGHDFCFWDTTKKPAFDAFDEAAPDIYIGTTYELSRAVMKCLDARPHVKVALFASAWGELADEIPEDEYPITRVGLQEKKNVESLRDRISFVFSHVSDKWLDPLLGGWKEAGVTPVGILNAADTFSYLGGEPKESLTCDVAFVGGWWDYKARNLGPYMLPLCHKSSGLNVKLFGNSPWPVAQYLGGIDEGEVKHLFASAAVCPNVSEPHSTTYHYDLVERPWKAIAAGALVVSDYVEGFRDFFPEDELPMGRSPAEFHGLVKYFVAHPEDRPAIINRARKRVLREHTYFQRVSKILRLFGLDGEAEWCDLRHTQLVLDREDVP